MLDGMYQPIEDKKDKSDPVLQMSITVSPDHLFQPFDLGWQRHSTIVQKMTN
jgi:hypothetical protein